MLENKLGITDSTELARMEERISKQKALEMFESGFFETLEPGIYKSLAMIHQCLFDEIYDFAGKLRKVNISKGNFRFAPLMYLETALQNIDKMPQSTFDEIVEKYVEMNVAHPFREGNGRSTRIWLDLMLKKEIGYVVDWSKVDKEDYLLAMERSFIKDIEIKFLLKNALTDNVNDREIYMKGIDHNCNDIGGTFLEAPPFSYNPNLCLTIRHSVSAASLWVYPRRRHRSWHPSGNRNGEAVERTPQIGY